MHVSRGIRRPHRKTKTGCVTCRQRRIKCDEERPQCQHCLKRDVQCVWEECNTSATSDSVVPVPPSDTPSVPTNRREPSRELVPSDGLPMMDMLGIELMHYYMAHTSLSFMNNPNNDGMRCLQIVGPRLALRNPALLHALFALTALHIHVSERDGLGTKSANDYLFIAQYHHEQSLEALPPVVMPYDPNTSEALFLGYAFLLLYIIACPASIFPSSSSNPFHWIRAAKDFGTGMFQHWDPFSGKDRPLIPLNAVVRDVQQDQTTYTTPRFPFPEMLRLIYLRGAPDSEELDDPSLCSLYKEAVGQLEFIWSISLQNGSDIMYLIIWPFAMTEGFFSLIMEKRPRALVIFLHYCVLLGQYQETWLSRNRGKPDTRLVLGLVGEEWYPWMQLPITQLEMPDAAQMDVFFTI